MMDSINSIMLFIASLPDNIRAGIAIALYLAAFLIFTALSSTGGKKRDRT